MDTSTQHDILDILGVGFGPSNLALAIALEEEQPDVNARFYEAAAGFQWHPGMLLDGSTMQIAFPKDLVTFRNPQSSYSFFSYLHEKQRLVDFVNVQTFYPTRIEFNDYLGWAAQRCTAPVEYSTRVIDVKPAQDNDGVSRLFQVVIEDVATKKQDTVLAKNIVLGMGLEEKIPHWATRSKRQFHNHNFLNHIADIPSLDAGKFVVLGGGQSAAEVVHYLYTNYPQHEVHNVFGRFGYSPADDSPFANRIFDPEVVDVFYNAPSEVRQGLMREHKLTNYSCVDSDLIREMSRIDYAEKVAASSGIAPRLHMHRASEILHAHDTQGGVEVAIFDRTTQTTTTVNADAVIFATGFRPKQLPRIIDSIPGNMGDTSIRRDYSLDLGEDVAGKIYLQGGTESTHGLTSSLLSNSALRAADIMRSIAESLRSSTSRS